MKKVTWAMQGPRDLFVSKMLDFFWACGTAQEEVDKFSGAGERISPSAVGSCVRFVSLFFSPYLVNPFFFHFLSFLFYSFYLFIYVLYSASSTGGMDAGWFFPSPLLVSLSSAVADPEHATKRLLEWTVMHRITECYYVGRRITLF